MQSELDPAMSKYISVGAKQTRVLHELLFSLYFPFLVVSAHEREPGGHWAIKLVHWAVSQGFARKNVGIEDYRIYVVDFLLVWIPAVLIFLSLRLLARFSFTTVFLRIFPALVAIAGFPLIHLHQRDSLIPFSALELALAGVCLLLWAYHKWPVSTVPSILLLILHSVLWSILGGRVGGAWILIWPSWYWRWGTGAFTAAFPFVIYPFLGLSSALLWAAYFRQTELRNQSTSTVAIA